MSKKKKYLKLDLKLSQDFELAAEKKELNKGEVLERLIINYLNGEIELKNDKFKKKNFSFKMDSDLLTMLYNRRQLENLIKKPSGGEKRTFTAICTNLIKEFIEDEDIIDTEESISIYFHKPEKIDPKKKSNIKELKNQVKRYISIEVDKEEYRKLKKELSKYKTKETEITEIDKNIIYKFI